MAAPAVFWEKRFQQEPEHPAVRRHPRVGHRTNRLSRTFDPRHSLLGQRLLSQPSSLQQRHPTGRKTRPSPGSSLRRRELGAWICDHSRPSDPKRAYFSPKLVGAIGILAIPPIPQRDSANSRIGSSGNLSVLAGKPGTLVQSRLLGIRRSALGNSLSRHSGHHRRMAGGIHRLGSQDTVPLPPVSSAHSSAHRIRTPGRTVRRIARRTSSSRLVRTCLLPSLGRLPPSTLATQKKSELQELFLGKRRCSLAILLDFRKTGRKA